VVPAAPVRVCFVCLGNICRSPTAAAVLRHEAERKGLDDLLEIESAGTGAWHVGEGRDPRAAAEARRRGVTLDGCARQFTAADFDRFDLVLAMDSSNARDLEELAPDRRSREKIRLLRSFGPGAEMDVADPYLGEDGFAEVYDVIEAACRNLLAHLRQGRPAGRPG
jgi:protein-tyrosine phosphatase